MMVTPHFESKFSGILSGLSLGACVPNLNSVALAVMETLACNAQNLWGHVTLTSDHAPFYSLNVWGLLAAN